MEKEESYYYHSDFVTCPFCDTVVSKSEVMRALGIADESQTENDDCATIECPKCDKDFYFETHVEITYSSYPDENKCL